MSEFGLYENGEQIDTFYGEYVNHDGNVVTLLSEWGDILSIIALAEGQSLSAHEDVDDDASIGG